MYRVLIVSLLFVSFVHQSQGQCTSTNCVGPSCKCMNTAAPGGLSRAETPQLVFLAFDGAITPSTMDTYTQILSNRINPNGCPIGMTFFVFHEYNDYSLTHQLYFKRQEIATHTISHTTPSTSWSNKTVQDWADEIGGMKQALSKFANIPSSAIRGARAPFLQTSGDNTFVAMKQNLGGAFYDCSFPTTNFTNPPVWPYTLDQGFQQDCAIPPCPMNKYAGIWTVPMVALNRNNTQCSMADACASSPNTNQETYDFLRTNFERHYNTSKAPFGVSLQANSWFQAVPTRLDGYKRFLDFLATKNDVYIVPIGRGLDWMKNPKPLSQVAAFFDCPAMSQTVCTAISCYYEGEASPVGSRYMKSCVECPDVYPWTRNPLGIL